MRKYLKKKLSSKILAKQGNVIETEKPTQDPTPEPLGAITSEQAMPESSTSSGAAPNPFDPCRFAVPHTVAGDVGIVKQLVTCPVRKPNRQEFVRVHPDPEFRLRAYILELKDEREIYLVDPAVAVGLTGEVRIVTLHLSVNRQGATFLWPVPEPGLDGRENGWWASARIAADKAESSWTRMVASMTQGAYDVYVASGVLGEPVWPDKSMGDIITVAFGEKFIIRDANHPVIRRLLGQE